MTVCSGRRWEQASSVPGGRLHWFPSARVSRVTAHCCLCGIHLLGESKVACQCAIVYVMSMCYNLDPAIAVCFSVPCHDMLKHASEDALVSAYPHRKPNNGNGNRQAVTHQRDTHRQHHVPFDSWNRQTPRRTPVPNEANIGQNPRCSLPTICFFFLDGKGQVFCHFIIEGEKAE